MILKVVLNYDRFKDAISILSKRVGLSEDEESYLYLKAKADLYGIYSSIESEELATLVDAYELNRNKC